MSLSACRPLEAPPLSPKLRYTVYRGPCCTRSEAQEVIPLPFPPAPGQKIQSEAQATKTRPPSLQPGAVQCSRRSQLRQSRAVNRKPSL